MNEIVYVTTHQPDVLIGRGRAQTIAADGSGPLLVNNYHTYSVRWSPQGNKLALTPEDQILHVPPYLTGIVYITDLDGSNAVRLNSLAGAPTGVWLPGGDFSPDASLFAIPWSDAVDSLYLLRTDGSGGSLVTLGVNQVTGGSGSNQAVLWFPDDSGFAYISADTTLGNQEIRTCARDGSGITTILAAPGPEWWGLCDTYANGDLLVMSTPQDTGAGQLIRCDRHGGSQVVLYDDPGHALIGYYLETGAALSPDETQIVIACNDGTLRLMPAGGGALTTIATDSFAQFGTVDWLDIPLTIPPTVIQSGTKTTGIMRHRPALGH